MPVKIKSRSSLVPRTTGVRSTTPLHTSTSVRGLRRTKPKPGITILTRRTSPLDLRLLPHPETGAVYIVAMPPWLRPLEEIRRSWLLHQSPWMKIIDTRQILAAMDKYRDERAVFMVWSHDRIPRLPTDRRAIVLPVYYEVVDPDPNKLMTGHRIEFQNFRARAREYDGIFLHTPRSAQVMHEHTGVRTAVLPVGCESRILGHPSNITKTLDACWYGLIAGGRRGELFRRLADPSLRTADIGGVYGAALVARMQLSKTVIYVKHSDIDFCSTWRIWQCASSSAAMIQEEGDAWPLTDDLCYRIPRVDEASIGEVLRLVRELSPEDALQRARAAHETLSVYTPRHCIDEYVVKATEPWLR